MRRILYGLVALAFAALPPVVPHAQEQVAKGFIAVEVEAPTEAPKLLDMALTIAAFTPEDQTFHTTGFGKGWAIIKINPREKTRRLYTVEAAPGTYAVKSMNVSHWAACFNGGTQVVSVRPGETAYLGRFDPNPFIEAIKAEVREGRLPRSARSSDNPTLFGAQLVLAPGDGTQEQAEMTPATFDTGEIGWVSKQRTCGVTEIMRRRANK